MVAFCWRKAKSPTPTCSSNIRKEGSKTRKCLCLLVKDRNEPRHGFKLNATLALSLPSVRHAPAKVSDCPALLNLPPNSTDAQVVEQLAANSGGNNITAVTVVPSSSNNTVKGRRWLGMVCAVSLRLVISL
ncbi:hypothetical protein AB3S75_032501 [Citrus x aurantiifolia]